MSKIATTVYTSEEISLRNGDKVTLTPLSLKALRVFMKKMEELNGERDEFGVMDTLLGLAAIELEDSGYELLKGCKYDYDDKKDELEDRLDMPTIHRAITVGSGIDLQNPNFPVTSPMEPEIPGTS